MGAQLKSKQFDNFSLRLTAVCLREKATQGYKNEQTSVDPFDGNMAAVHGSCISVTHDSSWGLKCFKGILGKFHKFLL